MLSEASAKGQIEVVGRGPATRYRLSPQAHVTMELDLNTYFDKEVDERQIQNSFQLQTHQRYPSTGGFIYTRGIEAT